ncbi:MAG: hypothetical protein EB084_00360 [Proteobacteria bacterium]|nr:hypothetical protein [Pseudomonadota bacterium]
MPRGREHARPRGFTLIEVIISTALLVAGLLVVVSLIPSGVLSLKKAEDLQTATAYALEVMETSRNGLEQTAFLDRFTVTLNDTEFTVLRETQVAPQTDGRLHDVIVTVEWRGQPAPVRLATRMPDARKR